jgi:PH (Pleckstrin Homology) domain-containing protein
MGAVPLATAGFVDRTNGHAWYTYPLLLILLIPIAVAVWGWRAGTDANAAGLLVRPYGLAARPVAWSEIVGIVPQNRRVYAILTDERAIPLPGVSQADLPRLIAAAGQEITADREEVSNPPAPH